MGVEAQLYGVGIRCGGCTQATTRIVGLRADIGFEVVGLTLGSPLAICSTLTGCGEMVVDFSSCCSCFFVFPVVEIHVVAENLVFQ
ncbi:hypothetical protein LJC43_01235 [Parabacteroides sp. OttesenSCG-928-G21]|nr:hypothetical protein [Parabacteroides sp. OttesenSCG-928-G21]